MFKAVGKARKNKKGFTLVELMVVVVIIGILIAIAIPVYSGVQANARMRACHANERTLLGAASVYRTESPIGAWPTAAGQLTPYHVVGIPACPIPGQTYVFTVANDILTVDCSHADH